MSHLQLGALAPSQGLSLSQTVLLHFLRQSPSAAAVPTRARCEARVASKDVRQNSDMRTDDQWKKSISRSLLV